MIHKIQDINIVFGEIDSQKYPITPKNHIYLN
jgi:hypothetical protein